MLITTIAFLPLVLLALWWLLIAVGWLATTLVDLLTI